MTQLDTPIDPAAPRLSPEATRRAARNAGALAISTVVAKGLLFVWQLALARWLGAGDYGAYGTIGALLAIGAAIPEFGMGLIVVRDVATRPHDAGRYLGATLVMQPLLAGAAYGALLVAAWLLGYDDMLRALLALAALSLLIDALGNMAYNQLIAFERMAITALISALHVGALVAFGAAALAAGGGLTGLYVAILSANMLRSGALWAVLRQGGVRPAFPLDRAIARGLLINGAPLALSSFLTLAYQHADKVITTALLGTEGTGQLTAAFVITFGVIELLSTTVLVAVFPLMSRTYSSGMRAMFEFMIEKLAFFNLLLSLPVALITSLLAVPLAALLFGADFARTASVLAVLIWYTSAAMISAVFAQALLIENRQRRTLAIRASGLALNVVLNLILLPAIGVAGAAVATLVSELVVLGGLVSSFRFPADWWARVRSHLWRMALAGAGMAAAIIALRGVHPLLAAAVGVPVYLALVLALGAIARDDWDLIYRLVMAMPGGAWIGRWWKRELA